MNRRFKNLISYILIVLMVMESSCVNNAVFAAEPEVLFAEEIIDEPAAASEQSEVLDEEFSEVKIEDETAEIIQSDEIVEVITEDVADEEISDVIAEDEADEVVAEEVIEEAEIAETSTVDIKTLSAADFPRIYNAGDMGGNVKVYINSDYSLTVSGNGKMADYSAATDTPWYKDLGNTMKTVSSINFTEDITHIGKNAFRYMDKVKELTISDNILSIGAGAFSGTKIEELTIPITATTFEVQRGSIISAFDSGNTIKKITITKGVSGKTIDYTNTTYEKTPWYLPTSQAAGTLELVLEEDIETVGNYAFYNNKCLKDISLNNISSVGEYAFSKCANLTSVSLNNILTSVDVKSKAFENSNQITAISVPVSAKYGADSFKGCTAIDSVHFLTGTGDATDFTTANYIYTPWFVSGSTKDITLEFDEGITSIGNYMFHGCTKIADFSSLGMLSSVTSIGSHAFKDCMAVTTFTVPSNVTIINTDTFAGCKNMTGISLPSTVTYFGRNAFRNCEKLSSFTIPNDFVQMHQNTFYGCTTISAGDLVYENPSTYHTWFYSPTFEDRTIYDIDTYFNISTQENSIFLKQSNATPPVVYHTYKYNLVISEGNVSQNEITVSGAEIARIDSLDTPYNGGKTFKGWYYDSGCSDGKEVSLPITLNADNSPLTIYAKWECEHPSGRRGLRSIPGKEFSCMKDGEGYEYCTVCGKTISDNIVPIPMIGHHTYETSAPYTRYRIIDADNGKARLICLVCGEDQLGPVVDIPVEVDEPLEKVSANKYRLNLVRGTTVTIPEIAKPKGAKKWDLIVPKGKHGIVGISKKGVVKGVRAGDVDITVDIVDKDNVSLQIELEIHVTTPGFTASRYYLNLGDALYLNEIFGEKDNCGDTKLRKEVEIEKEDILTYDDGTKAITGLKTGSSDFTVIIAGKKYKSCKIYVEDPALEETDIVIDDGKKYKMKVNGTSRSIDWRSEDESIATVDTAGRIYPQSTGVTFVHATVNGKELVCRVTVDKPTINFSKHELTVNSPTNGSFNVKLLDAHNHVVEWKSSREESATVDSSGCVTAVEAGITTISCLLNGMKYICVVTVYNPYIFGTGIVKPGKKISLKLKNGPDDVKWEVKSGYEDIVSIDQKGIVTGLKSGTAVVCAVTKDITVERAITVK